MRAPSSLVTRFAVSMPSRPDRTSKPSWNRLTAAKTATTTSRDAFALERQYAVDYDLEDERLDQPDQAQADGHEHQLDIERRELPKGPAEPCERDLFGLPAVFKHQGQLNGACGPPALCVDGKSSEGWPPVQPSVPQRQTFVRGGTLANWPRPIVRPKIGFLSPKAGSARMPENGLKGAAPTRQRPRNQ